MRRLFPERHYSRVLDPTGCLAESGALQAAESWSGRNIPGYRGIWFDLGQRSTHGSKYSGGLGTYTAKHCPLAIHAKAVNRTFFVYGGTPRRGSAVCWP